MILWIIGLSAAYAVALNGTMVMPVVVLAMSKLAGYDEGLATVVASAELAGIAIYGIFLPKLANRSWFIVALCGMLAVLVGEAASFWQQSPPALALTRFVTGLGEGAVFSVVAMNLASLANAERLWGVLALVGGTAMGVLLFVVSLMPLQQAEAPVFLAITAFAALMAPFLLLMARRPSDLEKATVHSKLNGTKMTLAMIIVFMVYAVQAGQWAICGYVGERVGLSNAEVGFYLAISSLAGFLGAVVPAMTQDKAKRLPFVMLGFAVMAISIYYLFHVFTATVFLATQMLVNIGFFIVTPFVTGVLTENDPDGSLMSRILVIAIIGATIGTALAGPVFSTAGAAAFSWYCLLPLALAVVCAVTVFGHLHRNLPTAAKTGLSE